MGQSVLLCFSTLCSCSRTLVTILRFWPTQTYITQGWCPCWFNHQNCYRNRRTCWGIHISTRATPLRNKMQLTACCVRQRFWTTGVPEVTMLQSWKKSTFKKNSMEANLKSGLHSAVEGKWIHDISVNNVLSYLTFFFEMGLGYSLINTACSCRTHPVGNHPLICRFMKGIRVSRTTQSWYISGWNVQVERQYWTLTLRTH